MRELHRSLKMNFKLLNILGQLVDYRSEVYTCWKCFGGGWLTTVVKYTHAGSVLGVAG